MTQVTTECLTQPYWLKFLLGKIFWLNVVPLNQQNSRTKNITAVSIKTTVTFFHLWYSTAKTYCKSQCPESKRSLSLITYTLIRSLSRDSSMQITSWCIGDYLLTFGNGHHHNAFVDNVSWHKKSVRIVSMWSLVSFYRRKSSQIPASATLENAFS